MTSPAPAPEPGWHLNANGQRQWWDGSAWGPVDAAHIAPTVQPGVVMVRNAKLKTKSTAYILAILFGTAGVHRFYLRRFGTAWVMLIASLLSFPFRLDDQHPGSAAIGWGTIAVLVVWVLVDLIFIPEIVRDVNR
ncbi:TM2 domain-containing protein [Microbacterium maritypicum]|uniref:TM2 domain-containing protein n=1 Tax=Microbacterium maritypicum TaxID=33918 RepID=UPI003826D5E2